ncbi:hypothetical protein NMG60_11036695 [Bertholletia excelsa]
MEPSVMEKKLEKGKEKCLDPFKVEPSVEEELSEMDMKIKDLKAEVKGLKRRMDFLNLILSYPWKAEEGQEFDFKSLGKDFSRINQLIRQLEAYPPDKFYDKFSVDTLTLQDRLLGVKEQLNRYESHIPSCLLPQVMDGNIGELGTSDELPVPPTSRSSSDKAVMQTGEEVLLQPPQEICDLAIDSVVHQVLEYFKQRSYGKIGICGSNSWKVLIVLKDLPEITSNFCVRSVSPSKYPINMTELKMEITELRTLAADHRPLLLVDIMDKQVDLHNLDFDGVATVLAIEANEVNEMLAVDLGIIMEDHLLPWKLFCNNVGCVLRDYSTLQYKAAILIEECHCHLLAIVLLAAALKGVTDESEWELAHSELIWRPSSEVNGTSVVMINVLRYIWERMDDKSKNCIKYCITLSEMKDLHYALLIHDWIGIGYADTEEEAKSILEGLNHSFLLEKVAGGFFRMIEEVRIVLLNIFVSGKDPAYLMQGDLGLTRIPDEMEWNVKEIHLMNNELSVLPAHPYCPFLMRLFLQGNHNLRVIPDRFFENMPMLQLLDLSYTSIKTLPDSISDLFSLQEFFLRGCDLLMKLPACMGDLTNLKVFDLEGTELIYPPLVIGEIVNLTCLNVCLYGYANHYLEAKKKEKIPRMKLSELSELIELSIEVHPEGGWWDDEVKELMNDLYNLKNLSILKLHLPNVGLLEGSICKKLSKFRFIVGHDEPPFESCVPQESEKEFKQWEKSLKHINGEDEPAKIAEVLQYANAFFLDRHWTIKKLSEFGIENMKELKFCLLVECNELETITDGEDKKDESQIELESLQYLSIHCMKKLESICRGPVGCRNFLFRLKFLALHTCPSLTTIFTLPMLYNLENLEEVIVQDCPRIKNLLSLESSDLTSGQFLPSLKKMSFLELPKLNSISSGLCIAPKLEILVIFCCPMLRSLSGMDISSKDFKAIKGEREWWDTLRWHESEMCKDEQDYLNNRFIEIERDPCLMTQLTNN